MFQNVHILRLDGILFLCQTLDSLSFHVLALATGLPFCFVCKVMIRKRGKEPELCSKSDRLVQAHLKRHVHLTNCIHLKHRLHMQKPRMTVEIQHPRELFLRRELAVLQRSRSLRDPSTSPSCMLQRVGSLQKKPDLRETRRVDSGEHTTTDDEFENIPERVAPVSASSTRKRTGKGHLSITHRNNSGDGESWVELGPRDSHEEGMNACCRSKHSSIHDMHHAKSVTSGLKSLAKRTSQFKADIDSGRVIPVKRKQERSLTHSFSRNIYKGKESSASMDEKNSCETDDSDYFLEPYPKFKDSGMDATRSRKWKKNRNSRFRPSDRKAKYKDSHDAGTQSTFQKQHAQNTFVLSNEGEAASMGSKDLEFTELSQNRCGIPWNWSQIHKRGKNFLDFAGRSLSCGASEQTSGKVGAMARYCASPSDDSMVPTSSEISGSSFDSSSESVPLLLEAGSPLDGVGAGESNMQNGRHRNVMARVGRSPKLHWVPVNEDRQLGLSQKYSPKSFNEIVGQNLVTQALSNALSRKRIASMYIFYGPRGTGKTSCAKVFTAALNCISLEEQKPCGSCSECLDYFLGKDSNLKVINAAENHGTKVIKTLIHDLTWSSSLITSPRYKVFVVDECHALSVHAWSFFFKVLEKVPKNIIFILFTNSLEELPYAIISRCQKFLFTKIKESTIQNRLHAISVLENLDVDPEALKLIASMADGSLRDGEMMLDQLSLFGQKISLSMVQELAGLIPDDKLVDLLDGALSADTVNTVRRLKDLIESGVAPLDLMSQLASMITNILGGGQKIPRQGGKRKFFCRDDLSKEETERLRLALKTLSEAEKQLRASSDPTTWLTAALLQFAPERSYLCTSSSSDTGSTCGTDIHKSFNNVSHSDVLMTKQSGEVHPLTETQQSHLKIPESDKIDTLEMFANKSLASAKLLISEKGNMPGDHSPQLRHNLRDLEVAGSSSSVLTSQRGKHCKVCLLHSSLRDVPELEDIWQRVLDAVHSNNLRKFLQSHATLLSINASKAFLIACLEFGEAEHQSRAERSKKSIAHAFQVTFGRKVEVKVSIVMDRYEQNRPADSVGQIISLNSEPKPTFFESGSRNNYGVYVDDKQPYHKQQDGTKDLHQNMVDTLDVHETQTTNADQRDTQGLELSIFEGSRNLATKNMHTTNESLELMWAQNVQGSPHHSIVQTSRLEQGQNSSMLKSSSAGKSKLSLGFIIQQNREFVEGRDQKLRLSHTSGALIHKCGRCRGENFTTAEEGTSALASEIEEENLRLESKSGGLLCWKLVKKGKRKVKKLHCCS